MTALILLGGAVTAARGQEPSDEDVLAPAAGPGSWSEEDTIVVIQRLPYERSGRWVLTPFGGVVPNDPFVTYLPIGLRGGRFFNESFLMEISASYLDEFAVDRDLRDRVGRRGGERSAVRLQDHQVARAQWSAAWTLVAGKARWFGDDLTYLRAHLLGGFGALLARDAAGSLDPRAEGLFGLGGEIHLSDASSLRVELRQTVFQRESGGALFPTELSVGYTMYLGGPLEGAR